MAPGLLFLQFLWEFCSIGGWGSCVWITTAEAATAQLCEKTITIATTCSFIMVLLVSFINPFVQDPPGNMGSKVGFIYGSFSLIAMAFVYFLVPELSNRSLEELNDLFQTKIPAWRFKDYKCSGTGAQLTEFQNLNADHTAHLKIFGLQPETSSPQLTMAAKIPKDPELTETNKVLSISKK